MENPVNPSLEKCMQIWEDRVLRLTIVATGGRVSTATHEYATPELLERLGFARDYVEQHRKYR